MDIALFKSELEKIPPNNRSGSSLNKSLNDLRELDKRITSTCFPKKDLLEFKKKTIEMFSHRIPLSRTKPKVRYGILTGVVDVANFFIGRAEPVMDFNQDDFL